MTEFDQIWNLWPNKTDKAGASQAFDYTRKKNSYSLIKYVEAVKLWLEKASDFQKENQKLSNWLRDDKYVVEINDIESSGGLDKAIQNNEEFKHVGHTVIKEWNRLRHGWWASVEDIEARSYVCERALRDDFFQRNWFKALNIIHETLRFKVMDSFDNLKVYPTIMWFCDIQNHTVASIMEGEFGKPMKKKSGVPSNATPIEKLSNEERKEITEITSNFLNKLRGEDVVKKEQEMDGPWTVRRLIHECQLKYNDHVIKAEPMPNKKSDQNALFNEMVSKADNFNSIGYEPDVEKQKEYERENK